MTDRVLAAGRLALGAIFVYAALVKVPDMAAFAADVANYRLAPAAAVPFLGSAVVGVELLAGLALMAGVAARGAALVAAGLLGVLMVAISQALLRGIDLRWPEPPTLRRLLGLADPFNGRGAVPHFAEEKQTRAARASLFLPLATFYLCRRHPPPGRLLVC